MRSRDDVLYSRSGLLSRLSLALALAVSAGINAPLPAADRPGEPRAAAPDEGSAADADDDLPPRVKAAVERGRRALIELFWRVLSQPPPDQTMGHIALPLAALLKAGVPSQDPRVTQGFQDLGRRAPQKVYSVACYLMALDALVQTREREARLGAQAGRSAPARAVAEGTIRERMEQMVKWLIAARNVGEGTWPYEPEREGHRRKSGGSYHDYSNTQFAVLGLQIALEHKIPVPREVFQEIVEQFARSQLREPAEVESSVTLNPGKKAFLTRAAPLKKTIRRALGGWGYRSDERTAYPSMTAAGASSLLVARGGLGGSLGKTGEAVLDSALAWIDVNFNRFFQASAGRFHYTLYSLEKVGDIGDIFLFGKQDWYREGSEALLSLQRTDGSWGSHVETAFALLFLTRATRPAVLATPAPRVVTKAGGGESETGDKVYLSTIDGYVSAAEFLSYLEATGDRDLVKVAEEVVRNYPLVRQGELVPGLLALWSERSDPVSSFARKALSEVTGERYRDAASYRTWHKSFTAVRAAEGGERDPDRVAALLAGAPGLKLKGRVVELIGRESLLPCVPALIAELGASDAAFRRRVCDILERLTGPKLADGESVALPENRESREAWLAIWTLQGERILTAARIRKRIRLLDAGDSEAALSALCAEGRAAVPYVLEAMDSPEFSARLVVALERISGKQLGLRPAAWRGFFEGEAKDGRRP